MLNTPEISLERLIYDSFANVLDARIKAQQNYSPAADELKAVEDQLWRLFIRQVYRDNRNCLRARAKKLHLVSTG